MRHKHLLYPQEQQLVRNELMSILDLDDKNSVTLYDLETSGKKERIMELLPRIRSFFSFGNVTTISNPDRFARPWMTIIKQLTKDKYDIISSDYRFVNQEGHTIRTRRYFFQKKTT